MRNYLAIIRKELHALFVSPIAYLVLAVFFALTGYYFYIILNFYVTQAWEMMMRSQQFGGAPPPMDVSFQVMRNFFGVLSTFLLISFPAVTMGTFAEEKKRGTMELLATSPITNLQLVLGKFTAVLLFLAVMLVPTSFNTLLLFFYSEPNFAWGPVLTCYLGALLLGGAGLSIGVFFSSLTENQIVAFFSTLGVFLLLWVLDASAGAGTSFSSEVIKYLSILNHYDDFTKGILDSQHVVFYLSFIVLGIFLTSVSLDSSKWRQ